jgi:ribosomal protein S18 acetylase RimI-like enzyme
MNNFPELDLDGIPYSIRALKSEDKENLQKLLEKCSDYYQLYEGKPVSSTAAQEVFHSGPPGRSLEHKFVFGMVAQNGEILGLLEGMAHYPDQNVWWIGLLLIAPELRGQGFGRRFVMGFEGYVHKQGGTAIMLGVVEENIAALRFWEQMGFSRVRKTEPRAFGKKMQSVGVMKREITTESTMLAKK